MLACCESHLSPFCAVDQVLDHFRDQFIREVDASAIVFGLENKGIIPNGVLTAVTKETSATRQNEILYAHLEATSTKDSLMTVCDMIIAVRGNPRMRAFGEDMKSKLEGKCCVCHTYMRAHLHVCMCGFVCTDDPNHTIPLPLCGPLLLHSLQTRPQYHPPAHKVELPLPTRAGPPQIWRQWLQHSKVCSMQCHCTRVHTQSSCSRLPAATQQVAGVRVFYVTFVH